MKKKPLAMLLIAVMALSFVACGNNSKETASTEEPKQEMQEETKDVAAEPKEAAEETAPPDTEEPKEAEVTEDETEVAQENLWGTKHPISGTLYYSDLSFPVTFEYNPDGSYKATLREDVLDHVCHYTADGKLTKVETYDFSGSADGRLQSTEFYIFGMPLSSDALMSEVFLFDRADSAIPQLKDMLLEYDENGNVTNDIVYDYMEVDLINKNTSFHTLEDLFAINKAAYIERDNEGRIICITNTSGSGTDVLVDQTDITYEGDTIKFIHTKNYPERYNPTTREQGEKWFEDGGIIVLNEYGVPIEYTILRDDGSESVTFAYNYDEYGSLVSTGKKGHEIFTFKYVYD